MYPDEQNGKNKTGIWITLAILVTLGMASGIYLWLTTPTTLPPPNHGTNGGILPPPQPVKDTEAPSTPTQAVVTLLSSSQVTLSWKPSSDNVGVEGYRIYRDGVLVGSTKATTFSDPTVKPSAKYIYVVNAFDKAGHESLSSEDIIVSISPVSKPPTGNGIKPIPTNTIPIKAADGSTISVRDFYPTAQLVTPDDVYINKDTTYYTLIYYPKESSFLITINNSNVPLSRSVAEDELPEFLGISKNLLCKLRFFITVRFDVNEKYAKENITLSFCPGGTPL